MMKSALSISRQGTTDYHVQHVHIFDDIHAHNVCVQKAKLISATMRKRSETIFKYAFIAII